MSKLIGKIRTGLDVASTLLLVKLAGRRIPLYCEWEVTSHCNMRCTFCSTIIEDRNKAHVTGTEEALEIIGQLAKLGTRLLHFSGGEPTLRSDLPDLIREAQRLGIVAALTTNGSASPETLKKISICDVIRVSIDGTEEFHDRGRNCPGAFKKAISAIDELRSLGIRPQMTTVYMPDTPYEMLASLASICREKGIQMAVNVMGKNVNARSGDDIKDLHTQFFKDYIAVVDRLIDEFRETIANPEPLVTIIKAGGLDAFGCRAMDIAICIKADGSVSLPCNGLTLSRIKKSLKEVYFGPEAIEAQKAQGTHPLCSGCYIKCMCSASGMLTMKGMTSIFSSYRRNLR